MPKVSMCCLQDTAPEDAVVAEEEIAAGSLAEQTPEDAAAAGEHLAEHIKVRYRYNAWRCRSLSSVSLPSIICSLISK
jgi:hypothetical protein